jgi:hypothetical protein
MLDMRRFLISRLVSVFLVLVFAPSFANAQWTRSGDWAWRILTESAAVMSYSQKYGSQTQLLVIFSLSDNCLPTLFYSQIETIDNPKKPEGPFQGGFQARIDNKAPWNINPGDATAFYSEPTDQRTRDYTIALNVKGDLVLELAYGQTFRILRTDTGGTDRFSLLGSAAAIRNAYRACKNLLDKSNPDLQYFRQRPPQKKKAPTQTQDPDRQFFR